MAIQINDDCSRCYRNFAKDATLEEATRHAELAPKKAATLKLITDFIATLPKETLPDVFVAFQGVVSHTILCDGPDLKRSCMKRVQALVDQIDTLDERKPRTPKTPVAT